MLTHLLQLANAKRVECCQETIDKVFKLNHL